MDHDAELLRLYLESRSEASFTALVQRHLPLVYSAALRQVGADPHRAQEVAQAVFTLFARKARQLRSHPALSGWFYTSTHHLAAKLRRSEQRRWHHEREAQAMHDHTEDPTAAVDWDRLHPVIDEAMLELKEHDRTAVLLRFFENRTYAEIGTQLSLSENTARMRVDRALDTLRVALARRGIISAATALGAVLSSHATVAIPAGLAAIVGSGALAASAAGANAILMSTSFFKTAAVTAVILTGATGLFLQHREIEKLRAENTRLQRGPTAAGVRNAGQTGQGAAAALAGTLAAEVEQLRAQVAELKSSPASSWQERVGLLHEVLEKLPEQGIPELQLATDDDWLDAAKEKLETTDDYRRALGKLRNLAIGRFAHLAGPALTQYLKAHDGQFPADLSQLQSYVDQPIDNAIWQHYTVAPADTVSNVRVGGKLIVTQRSVVDPTYDSEFVIGPDGFGTTTYGVSEMIAMEKAWAAANPGQHQSDLTQLQPYATTPRQKAALARAMEREGRKPSSTP